MDFEGLRMEYRKTIKTKQPVVSIIVPAFNVEKYVEKCINSLTGQTLKEIEIIIVNDGSTDGTGDIIKRLAINDKRIKIIEQENKLQGAARNAGTNISRGEYIGFVDADDWIDADYYEKLYAAAKKYNSDIALACYTRIGNGKTKKRLNINKEIFVTTLQEKLDVCSQAKNPCPTNKIYKREMLVKNNIEWEEGVYCEDKIFTLKAVYYANGVVTVPEINYYYYRNPCSTVNTKEKKRLKKIKADKEKAKKNVLEFLREHNAQIREGDFNAIKKKIFFLGIPIITVTESIQTEKVFFLGIPVLEKPAGMKYDYKRKRIKILGIKITYKSREWLSNAEIDNKNKNRTNLSHKVPVNGKSILFIATHFVKAGGIETRLLQYIQGMKAQDEWNIYLLSEFNENESLLKETNFYLNFDAKNFQQCLEEIIERYHIDFIEFQFKNSSILKKLDIEELKSKAKTGCVIHNRGVRNINQINRLDYTVIVSNNLYQNYYRQITNTAVVTNSIDFRTIPVCKKWHYQGQKTALLVSRINTDKLESIKCFIKYCKSKNIDFIIAGDEQPVKKLKLKLIKEFHLEDNIFIGEIDTLKYLAENMDNILFVGGLGLVILESACLGIPAFCCSKYKGKNYSFVTKDNVMLFDNFTIRAKLIISKKRKKEYNLDLNNIDKYDVQKQIREERNFINSLYRWQQILFLGVDEVKNR